MLIRPFISIKAKAKRSAHESQQPQKGTEILKKLQITTTRILNASNYQLRCNQSNKEHSQFTVHFVILTLQFKTPRTKPRTSHRGQGQGLTSLLRSYIGN